MTTGIYSLYWEEQDLIYIGQSKNIERRFTEHLYKLKNNTHTNYKVQSMYNAHGEPSCNILETCTFEDTDDLEVYYTKEFNSIEKGLNIVEAGPVGWGYNSNSSRYTKIQILKVFSLLLKTDLSTKDISRRLKVNKSLADDIRFGRSHLWLREEYSIKYTKMLLNRNQLGVTNQPKSISIKRNILIKDPEGNIHTIVGSVPEFCRTVKEFSTNIRQHYEGIARVIRGERRSHLGWRLA